MFSTESQLINILSPSQSEKKLWNTKVSTTKGKELVTNLEDIKYTDIFYIKSKNGSMKKYIFTVTNKYIFYSKFSP